MKYIYVTIILFSVKHKNILIEYFAIKISTLVTRDLAL